MGLEFIEYSFNDISNTRSWSQMMSVLVGKQAPDFEATAVMPNNSFVEHFKLSDYRGKYVVLFFWPLDFTFVCPSEIIAHHNRVQQFEERDVQVIGVSIDSPHTHFAWRNTPVKRGGIGEVAFPIVGDIKLEIVEKYGVLHP